MEFSDYARVLKRYWYVVLATTLAGLGAMYGVTKSTTPTYTATAQTVIGVKGAKSVVELNSVSNYLDSVAYTYAAVGGSQAVLEPAAKQLGLTYGDLLSDVVVDRPQYTYILVTTVKDHSAQRAADIANAVATEQTKVLPTLVQLPNKADQSITVTQITEATVATVPTAPSLPTNLAIGGGAGLVLGLGLAFALNARRRRSREERLASWPATPSSPEHANHPTLEA